MFLHKLVTIASRGGKGMEKTDVHKFSSFIAENRKAKDMTQADLAIKLHVTDKAVSRWERGLGFSDINTLEPLAEALDVTLLELMRCERETETPIDHTEAEHLIVNTLDIAITQKLEEQRKMSFIVILSIVAILTLLVIDAAKGRFQTLTFLLIAAVLPFVSAISGLSFLFLGLWRRFCHKSAAQTFIGSGICTAVFVVSCIANIILVRTGIFPAP